MLGLFWFLEGLDRTKGTRRMNSWFFWLLRESFSISGSQYPCSQASGSEWNLDHQLPFQPHHQLFWVSSLSSVDCGVVGLLWGKWGEWENGNLIGSVSLEDTQLYTYYGGFGFVVWYTFLCVFVLFQTWKSVGLKRVCFRITGCLIKHRWLN